MFKQFNENIRQIYLATSLYDCIEDNNINAVKTLLDDNGANPNIILPDKGISPFHLIIGNPVEKNAEEVTRLFLQHGGNPNVRSEENMTPVHVAAAWGRKNLLELLLKCGGDANLRDDEEKTPLDYAQTEGHLQVVTLLKQFNENILYETCQNNYNLTLEKVIINNGIVVAEYNACQSDKNCTDDINNFLKDLPNNEINSYVKNWCIENANITKDNMDILNSEIINRNETFIINDNNMLGITESKNKCSYFSDEFVTKRTKKFFDIAEDNNEYNYVCNSTRKSPKKKLNLSKDSDKTTKDLNESFIQKLDNVQLESDEENTNKINDNACLNGSNKICNEENQKIDSSGIIIIDESNNILEKSFIYLSDDSFENKKNYSRESGLQTIPSDSSDFHTSLEPLNECKYIGTINSSITNNSKSSKYTTCEDTGIIKSHEINIIDSSIMTSDVTNERNNEDNPESINNSTDDMFVQCNIENSNLNKALTNDAHFQESNNWRNPNKEELNCTRIIKKDNVGGLHCVSDTENINLNKPLLNNTHVMEKSISLIQNASHMIENTHLIHATGVPFQVSSYETANESFMSVAEEYKYTDKKEGIVLIERRYLVAPQINIDDTKSCSSLASSLPTTIDYDTETLRKELTYRGEEPGPITSTTKRVYLRKLMRLQKVPVETTPNKNCNRIYSVELEKTLRNCSWKEDLTIYKELESAMVRQFSQPDPSKKWREGHSKASFTYLLMDPRTTQNLPARSEKMDIAETWKTFLSSVFYVGKGKRSRPYSHLYDAIEHWNKGVKEVKSKKITHILDIWNDGKGVVCLHIFQNVIPVEAYTREAAIISAIKLQNLRNAKAGDFYGVSATWSQRQKRLLGVYLLYRAMHIFLNEGERQLRPDDI